MKILALDISSSTGWALIENGKPVAYSAFKVKIENFNINDFPEKAKEYPYNLVGAAEKVAINILSVIEAYNPDILVIENTVKGKNRNSQRFLEWTHYATFNLIRKYYKDRIKYIDPSAWRSKLGIRLSKEDKKNNAQVSAGKARGRITRKHLALRYVKETFNIDLKVKDDDIADAICLGYAASLLHNENML